MSRFSRTRIKKKKKQENLFCYQILSVHQSNMLNLYVNGIGRLFTTNLKYFIHLSECCKLQLELPALTDNFQGSLYHYF